MFPFTITEVVIYSFQEPMNINKLDAAKDVYSIGGISLVIR